MKKILLLPLFLTLLVGCSAKDKTYIERRDDCADVYGRVITPEKFMAKYKLGIILKQDSFSDSEIGLAINKFCQFYSHYRPKA